MPDWSYRTMFRPLLFTLPARLARDITLQAMGTLSKIPWGSLVIRTLGHMESYSILETTRWGIKFKYPVGLSGNLDIHGKAQTALAQFGFGFFEVGPITLDPIITHQAILRDIAEEAIHYPNAYINDGADAIAQRLQKKRGHHQPLMLRLRHRPGASIAEALSEQKVMMEKLTPYASGFYIDAMDALWSMDATLDYYGRVLEMAKAPAPALPIFLYVPLGLSLLDLERLLIEINFEAWAGAVVGDSIDTEQGCIIGREGIKASLAKTKLIRAACKADFAIIASAGIHQPQDALDLLDAGADFLQLHSGLVYSGPGLPKRINEAIIYERIRETEPAFRPSFWGSWGWMCLLGMGMFFGGIIAWIIAATSVVLPYDESFLGAKKSLLMQLNHHLLPFMSHDRITLAGTMISIGIFYFQLAKYGLRQGLHWSQTALLVSGIVGFCSFFLYLGHGYFDPLHAFVAAVLFPMFILSMRVKVNEASQQQPNLINDRTWLTAQWGQLMFVVLGFALAIGGASISIVGVTHIFVSTDLAYLKSTHDEIGQLNDHLLSLIAHDRAGFGGALFSDAIAILAIALWGISQGQRWVWWTLLLGGFPGFLAVFSVHWMIGYTNFWHLLPAFFAVIVYLLGLIWLYPYLMQQHFTVKKELTSSA
jgi:dihydroorotate dehydrogenase